MEKYDDWNLTQPSDMGTIGKCPLCKSIVEYNDIEKHIQYHIDDTETIKALMSSINSLASMFGVTLMT